MQKCKLKDLRYMVPGDENDRALIELLEGVCAGFVIGFVIIALIVGVVIFADYIDKSPGLLIVIFSGLVCYSLYKLFNMKRK